jgi:hypothetical protein
MKKGEKLKIMKGGNKYKRIDMIFYLIVIICFALNIVEVNIKIYNSSKSVTNSNTNDTPQYHKTTSQSPSSSRIDNHLIQETDTYFNNWLNIVYTTFFSLSIILFIFIKVCERINNPFIEIIRNSVNINYISIPEPSITIATAYETFKGIIINFPYILLLLLTQIFHMTITDNGNAFLVFFYIFLIIYGFIITILIFIKFFKNYLNLIEARNNTSANDITTVFTVLIGSFRDMIIEIKTTHFKFIYEILVYFIGFIFLLHVLGFFFSQFTGINYIIYTVSLICMGISLVQIYNLIYLKAGPVTS